MPTLGGNYAPECDTGTRRIVAIDSTSRTGGYELMGGISLAAALYNAVRPNATPAGVRLWLTRTASASRCCTSGSVSVCGRCRGAALSAKGRHRATGS